MGGGGSGGYIHQLFTIKTQRPGVRLAIKMPVRALLNANAAPFLKPQERPGVPGGYF